MPAYHLRGTLLPHGDQPRDLWVSDGSITFKPVDGAEELAPLENYVLPGLVDCHVHLTLDFADSGLAPGSAELVDANLRGNAARGVLTIRDMGAVGSDATLHVKEDNRPRVHPASRLLAPAGRYFGIQLDTGADELVAVAEQQARSGVSWVKIIADFNQSGDLMNGTPNYPQEILDGAVRAAHAAGARVAVHAVSRGGIEAGLYAGVDSIEHGTAVDESLLRRMAENGVAWTPTLVIAAAATTMSEEMGGSEVAANTRAGFESAREMVSTAARLGVTILAGTDMLPPGNVWQEIAALQASGLDPADALAAATTTAREFLGEPSLDEGAPADLVLYERDPRNDPEILARPSLVMLGGRVVRAE